MEFEVNVGMKQGPVLSPFPFAVVATVVTEFVSEGALGELLHANDLVLISEKIVGLKNRFIKWKEAFETKVWKVYLGKTNVMVSGGITKDGMCKSNVDPCGVCSMKVKDNSALCLQCGKWIHSRCARVKKGNSNVSKKFYMQKM